MLDGYQIKKVVLNVKLFVIKVAKAKQTVYWLPYKILSHK
jgi:hypothetical protein